MNLDVSLFSLSVQPLALVWCTLRRQVKIYHMVNEAGYLHVKTILFEMNQHFAPKRHATVREFFEAA